MLELVEELMAETELGALEVDVDDEPAEEVDADADRDADEDEDEVVTADTDAGAELEAFEELEPLELDELAEDEGAVRGPEDVLFDVDADDEPLAEPPPPKAPQLLVFSQPPAMTKEEAEASAPASSVYGASTASEVQAIVLSPQLPEQLAELDEELDEELEELEEELELDDELEELEDEELSAEDVVEL